MNQWTNDLEVLSGLHERGDLNDEEFARAKAALLGTPSSNQNATVSERLNQIEQERSLDQLERDWEMERAQYKRSTSGGEVENTAGMVLFGILSFLWLIFLGTLDSQDLGAGGVLFFGMGFLVFGGGFIRCLASYNRSKQYKEALARYDLQLAMLLKGNKDADR